jgi:hypothetical protein
MGMRTQTCSAWSWPSCARGASSSAWSVIPACSLILGMATGSDVANNSALPRVCSGVSADSSAMSESSSDRPGADQDRVTQRRNKDAVCPAQSVYTPSTSAKPRAVQNELKPVSSPKASKAGSAMATLSRPSHTGIYGQASSDVKVVVVCASCLVQAKQRRLDFCSDD